VQTELFLTFPPPVVQSITLIPRNAPETAGRFRVWLRMGDDAAPIPILAWDRKVEGGFPELKVLVGFDVVPYDISTDAVRRSNAFATMLIRTNPSGIPTPPSSARANEFEGACWSVSSRTRSVAVCGSCQSLCCIISSVPPRDCWQFVSWTRTTMSESESEQRLAKLIEKCKSNGMPSKQQVIQLYILRIAQILTLVSLQSSSFMQSSRQESRLVLSLFVVANKSINM
jgi:predicted Rdx family selenoprotein